MAAVVGIVGRHGHSINEHHRYKPNNSKLVMYKPLLLLYWSFKQLYISNKMECSSYKDRCGMHGRHTHIKAFKRKAGLAYR